MIVNRTQRADDDGKDSHDYETGVSSQETLGCSCGASSCVGSRIDSFIHAWYRRVHIHYVSSMRTDRLGLAGTRDPRHTRAELRKGEGPWYINLEECGSLQLGIRCVATSKCTSQLVDVELWALPLATPDSAFLRAYAYAAI